MQVHPPSRLRDLAQPILVELGFVDLTFRIFYEAALLFERNQ